MLVLSRKAGERIVITVGKVEIVVAYLGARSGSGRIGIEAPHGVAVNRQEIQDAIDRDARDAR
jgi:carbon storage regulator